SSASATNQTASLNAGASLSAASTARRVLPLPPDPVSVTNRRAGAQALPLSGGRSRRQRCSISVCLPKKRVKRGGRLALYGGPGPDAGEAASEAASGWDGPDSGSCGGGGEESGAG